MSSRALVLMLVALLIALPVIAATTPEEVEEDLSMQTKLVTPHLDLGQPYAGGKVRALFFVFGGHYGPDWTECESRYREALELCQRFDIVPDGVIVNSGGGNKWNFHGGKIGEERAEKLLEKPHDVIVIAGFDIGKLPAKMQYLILKQVAEGAGLVCCGGAGNEFMVPKRQIKPTPESLTNAIPAMQTKDSDPALVPATSYMNAYTLGKGRGVWLRYDAFALTPRLSFTFRRLAEYDYRTIPLGRAVQWAANKEGAVQVKAVLDVKPAQQGREDKNLPGDVVISSTLNQPLQATVILSLRRADDGLTTPLGNVPVTLKPAENAIVPIILPRLRAGDYYLCAVVKSNRGVEACGANLLTIESPYGVSGVKLDRDFAEYGETITGTATLRGALPPQAKLLVRLRDSYDRVLSRQYLTPQAGQADYRFTYKANPFDTILMRAEAVVVVDSQEVEMKSAEFTVPKRRRDQFNFVMWDGPSDVIGYYGWKQLQEVGYNICLMGSMGGKRGQPPVIRACDTSMVPYSTRIMDPKDEKGYMQPVCWNDEPAVSEYVQKIVDNQENLRKQGVFAYSLGDEGVTKGCCVNPACIAAYRKWLQGQYGTIAALNASWGSTYGSFEEVNLLDTKDNMETAALRTCPPRWYDRAAFARYNLGQFSGRFGQRYKLLDPQAITGFEGTGGFGDDYDSLLAFNEFYGPYPSIGDDIVRSAAPRELIRSNWMGYSKTGDALSDAAWRMIMKGLDSSWYWMWDGMGNWRGVLAPTFDYWECTADFLNEMKPVREGLGDLLLKSQMAHSGIAILYSLPSSLSHPVEMSGTFNSPETTHNTWAQLTFDIGQDFRYVTDAMLKKGALTLQEFPVLCLPMTQALSPEQAAAIRRYVESGGTVIADVRPAIFDGHMKAVTPGLLDDLFGVKRAGRGKSAETDVALKGALGAENLDLKFHAKYDPEVRLATAKALAMQGEAPLLCVNPVGQGQAVLLNFQLQAAKEDDDQAKAMRSLLSSLYRFAHSRPLLNVASPAGEPLMATETRVWRNGDAMVFGIWRQMRCAWFSPKGGTVAGEPSAARVTLPKDYIVYDLRAGKCLGKIKAFDTKLRWGRANFYLALPYQPKSLSVALAGQPRPGTPLTADLKLDVPAQAREKHAVYVEVLDPQGQSPLWGRKVVLLNGGSGQVQFPTAYNDAAGQWKLRATALFSGLKSECGWKVQ